MHAARAVCVHHEIMTVSVCTRQLMHIVVTKEKLSNEHSESDILSELAVMSLSVGVACWEQVLEEPGLQSTGHFASVMVILSGIWVLFSLSPIDL